MKARLVPLYFGESPDEECQQQVVVLQRLLAAEAEILNLQPVGSSLPEADAVLFPQMLGEAYRSIEQIRLIPLPKLVITSEFGTVSMWDWEINRYLRQRGIDVLAPYSLEQARLICRALGLRRELRGGRFLVYQDNPGEGFQASIFKRFYWWEDEWADRLWKAFGIQLEKRSFKELGARARSISDEAALEAWGRWRDHLPVASDVPQRSVLSAFKLYLALREHLTAVNAVLAAGINCLNESHFSDTTPCLAWNLLYQEMGLIWGCEADTATMLTELLVQRVLGVPFMMTNMYPFLMGQAALKHERIPYFPEAPSRPENYVLAAHCGYFGVIPQPFSTRWTLRRKVLAIVDDNATAIDARFAEGPITLVKIDPMCRALSVVEGELETYAQFANSDCLNGAVIRVPDGHRLMRELVSHHYIVVQGYRQHELELLAAVFGLRVEAL
ncbi:MAG: hypothetical protein QXZ09_08645 [Candidatus Methanomethylicaceae archaeon]|nr:hypothetical protein [candidate division KSB1 bacterium]